MTTHDPKHPPAIVLPRPVLEDPVFEAWLVNDLALDLDHLDAETHRLITRILRVRENGGNSRRLGAKLEAYCQHMASEDAPAVNAPHPIAPRAALTPPEPEHQHEHQIPSAAPSHIVSEIGLDRREPFAPNQSQLEWLAQYFSERRSRIWGEGGDFIERLSSLTEPKRALESQQCVERCCGDARGWRHIRSITPKHVLEFWQRHGPSLRMAMLLSAPLKFRPDDFQYIGGGLDDTKSWTDLVDWAAHLRDEHQDNHLFHPNWRMYVPPNISTNLGGLLSSNWLKLFSSLDLGHNNIGFEGAKNVANSENLRFITSIDLGSVDIGGKRFGLLIEAR